MPVIDDLNDEVQGVLSGILIEPDSGNIEGFFVHVPGFLSRQELYCSAMDIVRWGTRVVVRDPEAVSTADDRIRLQPLLQDPRTVIGQKMRTESGKLVGVCRDVQFDTEAMHVEWLFPKRWWKWGIALPLSEVVEIKPAAIILRDPKKMENIPVESVPTTLPKISEISDPGFSHRSSQKYSQK